MKYVRASLLGIAAASLAWLLGMFLTWNAYGFWEVGKSTFDGAATTRFWMLWSFFAAGGLYLAFRRAA